MSDNLNWIQQIIPCTGWSWVGEGMEKERPIIFEVAAWALTKDGDVIGLIGNTSAVTAQNYSRLVSPPPTKGVYMPTKDAPLVPRKKQEVHS